jgi:hypothetical protein
MSRPIFEQLGASGALGGWLGAALDGSCEQPIIEHGALEGAGEVEHGIETKLWKGGHTSGEDRLHMVRAAGGPLDEREPACESVGQSSVSRYPFCRFE